MMNDNSPRDFRRFAPIGLYLSGLALLAAAVLFVIQRSFSLAVEISLGFIVIGLALYVLLNPQGTREALTGRQARYGSNALLMSVAFIGIIVIVNVLVSSYTKQWDLTEDKTNSLTDESVKTLQSLPAQVKAEAFYTTRMSKDTARTLLQNYKAKSNGKFDFQFIDPETNPILAQQDKVTRDGTIVLVMGNRQEQVSFADEQSITTGLIRLANPGKRVVYFLTGHGEYGTDTTSDNNYSQVKTDLTAKNYTVNTLNLLATPKIPDDALAVIVAGPTKPLSQQEVDLLKAYQEKGGSLVYLADPREETQADPMSTYLQQTWGIKLDNDLVIETTNNQLSTVVATQRFGDSPITQKMYTNAVVFPNARSVRAGTAPSGVTLTPLAYSSNNSWGETDFQALKQNQAVLDPSKDVAGPVTLAVSGENSNDHARVLVIGSAGFASSQVYTSYGNSDFILNSIDWTAKQDSLISLTPRQATQRIIVAPQREVMGLILLGTIFLLPGLVVVTGVTVWAQRRRRG